MMSGSPPRERHERPTAATTREKISERGARVMAS